MSKLIQCKTCSKEISSNAKTCPSCGAKNKKPIYRKVWFWVLIVIVIGAFANGGSDDSELATTNKQEISQNQKTVENVPVEEKVKVKETVAVEEKVEKTVPTEYKSALNKAKTYSDIMSMSKAGIYDQLTSEYGEKFSKEAAQYAIDNVKADWKGNALKKAQTYQKEMSMSPNAVYDQLISENGEKFTAEEAQYAKDNLK